MGAGKQWTGKEKLQIVLRGLAGKASLAEICNENGITQGMYSKRRGQLTTDGEKVFERGGVDKKRGETRKREPSAEGNHRRTDA